MAFRLLELATDCILPLNEALALTGEETAERALYRLAKKTAAQLIVTDGVRGSWALTKDGVVHQPAFSVDTVDTTGCGDVFHGTYAAALVQGATLSERVRLASAAAALKATQPGGQRGIPTRSQVDEFLQSEPEILS